jgi:hypothetical protein
MTKCMYAQLDSQKCPLPASVSALISMNSQEIRLAHSMGMKIVRPLWFLLHVVDIRKLLYCRRTASKYCIHGVLGWAHQKIMLHLRVQPLMHF